MSKTKYYYESRLRKGLWYGVVYHWENDSYHWENDRKVIDHTTSSFDSDGEAIDSAVEWMEENDIDGEMS